MTTTTAAFGRPFALLSSHFGHARWPPPFARWPRARGRTPFGGGGFSWSAPTSFGWILAPNSPQTRPKLASVLAAAFTVCYSGVVRTGLAIPSELAPAATQTFTHMFEKVFRPFARRDLNQFPEDENGDVLYGIWKQGTDLAASRTVDFSLIFPMKEQAEAMAAKLSSREGNVKLSYFDAKACWDICFSVKMVPSWTAITEMEEWLGEVAAKHQGKNDGWGFFSQP